MVCRSEKYGADRSVDPEPPVQSFRGQKPLPPIASIIGSPILHHIAVIQCACMDENGYIPMDNAALALLTQHAPNLTALWCTPIRTPHEPLVLPAKLKALYLRLGSDYSDASVNDVLTSVASLPSLSHLDVMITAFAHANAVELRRLAECPSLTHISLYPIEGEFPVFADAQVSQIRSSLGHLQSLMLA